MICEKKDCTGCFACYNICLNNAIEMKEDEFGFIYPEINQEKCTNCNLCKKICPVNTKLQLNDSLDCYAAKSKNIDVYKTSSSGGLCTEISKFIIENNGCVYGAALVENCSIQHVRIDNINGLKKIQGSKYVHSYTMNSYNSVKKDLNDGKIVLYIGTPCQIAGLKSFLMKEYENLYTIDLICHGVPSQQFLRDEIEKYMDSNSVDEISFRGEKQFSLVLNKEIEIPSHKSYYFFGFLKSYFYRENCYNCRYATDKRISDITLGDFWGLKTNVSFEHNMGINCVSINTSNGKKLFEQIKDLICYERVDYQEAIDGNAQLRKPSEMSKQRKKFISNYLKNGFERSCKKAFGIKFIINKILKELKNIMKKNTIFFNLYKKIKK